MKKIPFILLTQSICIIFCLLMAFMVLYLNKTLEFGQLLQWWLFLYTFVGIVSVVIFSNRYFNAMLQVAMSFASTMIASSMAIGFILYAIINSHFNFAKIDWFEAMQKVVNIDFTYIGLVFLSIVLLAFIYCAFIDRRFILFFKGGVFGKGKLKQIKANLENSHWLTRKESEQIFKYYKYSQLADCSKDGVPVIAKYNEKSKDMEVAIQSPCHALVIGSTGSGKTTTFVNPMIQILATTKAGSSMVISDPKGELFALHSKYLKSRGYDVKIVDLRDAYSSCRWNPLDSIWDLYQEYVDAENNVYKRTDEFKNSGLPNIDPVETFEGIESWYEFDGKAYSNYEKLVEGVKIYKKRIYDEVYEDLNDLVSVLIPIENPRDPMWEKGARNIVLAVLLAMLEDSEDSQLNMTKEKYNFFNMTKILQSSSNDYFELINYFGGRDVLSKAYSLSKQVCDCAPQTRASYMSIVYEKLTLFNDAGICALTSCSDFSISQLAEKPSALFIKIPDEKDTRHNLASLLILDIYKTLVKVASNNEELSLPRNVYFILDEFGNIPKIEKFDKMITVGRSRKIWFSMVIQSYAQLTNVYGQTVADIIKGNCAMKMFIGSNDMNTCKEYSELCGNITVVTQSSSSNIDRDDINLSNQIQLRPLIYPSELQRLNKPGDIGHAVVVTFGNYPLKSNFTPSFKVPLYIAGKIDISEYNSTLFDEEKIFYDVEKRNALLQSDDDILDSINDAKTSIDDNYIDKADEAGINKTPELEELIELFNQYKSIHPDSTLQDFLSQSSTKKGGKRKK